MKFAHFADLHLGYEQYNQPWRAEDFSRSFKAAAEKAIDSDVEFAVISGDLFHRSLPSPKTIKEAIETLFLFRREKIPVFAVEGNHDKTSREISAYHLLESLGLLKVLGLRRERVEAENAKSVKVGNVYLVKGFVGDVELIGDRHRSRWQLEKVLPVLKPESEGSILVLHQAVKEVVDVEIEMAYELTINDLPEASYYAFGHIHIPKIYRFKGKYIAYPGSIERYDLREASKIVRYSTELISKEGVKKGFMLVENFKPEFVEVETRELYDVEIEDERVEELERKFYEVLGKIKESSVAIFKLKSKNSIEVKRFSEAASGKAKYAEVRFERVMEGVEFVELKNEREFFTDFELKLLDLLKDEVDEDEVYRFIIEHYFSEKKEEKSEKKVEVEAEEKEKEKEREKEKEKEEKEKEKKYEKRAKPRTLLDFLEG